MLFEIYLEQDKQQTRITCKAVTEQEHKDLINEAQEKPEHWERLEWHYMAQHPCLWGDNVFVAVEPDLSIGYVIFDGWCAAHKRRDAKRKWANAQEFFELDAKVGCGHFYVEELG